ncbi:glycosyltransferase [Modestobacter sp. NPDC049651]|uniref:glycosyltransferase n=1 Tax=unclassified Modestobacter TaxID=2643866 RepID=UPI0033FB3BC6
MTSTVAHPVPPRVDAESFDVVVGIVTHRRPGSLRTLLEQLARLTFPGPRAPRLLLLVVDNSPDLEARRVVEGLTFPDGTELQYVPHGAGNIASGRNAVLDGAAGRAPLLALIDDDEVPAPDWLHRLIEAQRTTTADLVCGPVLADHPAGAPDWIRRPVFHSVVGEAGWVPEAHAGNLLVTTALLQRLGLRFEEELGSSGGEDQLFSRQAVAGGATIWFEPTAVAREAVPRERLSVRYLLRREHRKGTTLGLLDRSRPGWPAGRPGQRVVRAGYWAATGVIAAVAGGLTGNRVRAVTGAMRIARAAGMLEGLRGRTVDLYARPTAPAATGRGTVAVVAAEGPDHQEAGHSKHLRGLLDHLRAEGHDVVLLVTGGRTGFAVRRAGRDGIRYRTPSLRTVAGVELLTGPSALAGHLAWQLFRRLPHRAQTAVDRLRTAWRSRADVDHVLGRWLAPAESAWVRDELAAVAPEVVLFNTVFSVPRPLVLPDSVRVSGVISHDVVSERADSFRAAGHRVEPADFSARQESAVLAQVDLALAIQWDDERALTALAPRATVVVTPVALAVDPVTRADVRPGRCLFVGSGTLHNVEGLRWFLQDVWPEVLRRRPGSELHVVGTVCARVPSVPSGVVLRGEVPSLTPEYTGAAVAIAPLRAGSGLKVKVVEALCHGVATVTTSVGAQGLGGLQPAPFVVADTAPAFAGAVVELLDDDAQRQLLEARARSAARRFSPGEAYAELDRQLAVLTTDQPA